MGSILAWGIQRVVHTATNTFAACTSAASTNRRDLAHSPPVVPTQTRFALIAIPCFQHLTSSPNLPEKFVLTAQVEDLCKI